MNSINNLRNGLIAIAMGAVVLGTPQILYASGVPTLDVANLTQLALNALEQANQAAEALKTAKDGIDQVRDQYNNYKGLISGNDNLGDFLNNPALNRVLPLGEWSDVYSSVKDIASLRQRYGLTSNDVTVQQRFDRILAGMDALERTYDASTERVRNAEQLRAQLNQVQTPQQKSDLQLRYSQELLEQQNAQSRLANLQMLQAQQEKIEERQKQKAYLDKYLR